MKFFDSLAYTLLRVVAGIMLFWHGSQKILGFPPAPPMPEGMTPPAIMGQEVIMGITVIQIAGWIELVGGALIVLGLLTRLAAFLASGLLAGAYFTVHMPQDLSDPLKLFPIFNNDGMGELAILYAFVFFYIFVRGGGAISIDNLFNGNDDDDDDDD